MIIGDFLSYLRYERNYSARTVEEYGDDLKEFELYFTHLDAHLSWESVDSDVIRDWIESMMDKGNRATSIGRRLSALRSLYRFALSKGLVAANPTHGIEPPKKEKPLPLFVREGDMEALLDYEMWDMESFTSVRTRTIILTLYETGMRISELINLDDTMVDMDKMQLKVTGKRDKQRIVPFGEELRNALKAYIAMRDKSVERKTTALFVTTKGRRENYWQLRRHIRSSLARVCTLPKRSPHVLRHTFATAMLNNGASIENVKLLLGHSRLATTEIYTHTTFEQLKKAYKNAHPRE